MPAQKCFSVKIRTGARTPFEASVTMLSVNDELMSLNGSAVRTSEIGERILGAINREFKKPLKSVEPAAQSGEAPVQQLKAAIALVRKQALSHLDTDAQKSKCCDFLLTIEQRAAV